MTRVNCLGLKGWSCCNKRVVDFDEFLAIPGCTFGKHTTEKQSQEIASTQPKQESNVAAPTEVNKDGVEVYGESKPVASIQPAAAQPIETPQAAPAAKKEEPEEEDDESLPVSAGTICKRKSCGVAYKDNATSRGDGAEAKCRYHPGQPIFHEGSKGWSCCKRRVLEFDEFLKIPGCKEGKHLFVGRQTNVRIRTLEQSVFAHRS